MKKILTTAIYLFLISFFLSGEVQATAVIIDHESVAEFDYLVSSGFDFGPAQRLVIAWNHRSIGNNILQEGFPKITNPSINISSGSGTNQGINHYQVGSNQQPFAKIAGFKSNTKSGHDISFMKFCVGDFSYWSGVSSADIWNGSGSNEGYREALEDLSGDFSDTAIVWWTSPITTQSDGRGLADFAQFNGFVRNHVNQSAEVEYLFDIADIESHAPDGIPVFRGGYEAMDNNYSTDGAHLNSTGATRVAKAMWVLFATIANGGGEPTNTPVLSPSPTPPACLPGDANEDGEVTSTDLAFVLAHYSESQGACFDQNEDYKINAFDFSRVLMSLPNGGGEPTATPTSGGGSASRPWGAYYAPHEAMATYGMTGVISGTRDSSGEIIETLRQAESGGYGVVISVGPDADCNSSHWLDGTEARYQFVLDYYRKMLAFTASQKEELTRFINNGTLIAFRFYDEAHYAKCGGVSRLLEYCPSNTSGEINPSSTTMSVMHPGLPGQPGFGDLLHQLMTELPSGLVVGSTSHPGYMAYVVDRINQLRGQPLPPNSILVQDGPSDRIKQGGYPDQVRKYFECSATKIRNSEYFFHSGNVNCEADTDIHFWENYTAMCAVPVDYPTSWTWPTHSECVGGSTGDRFSRLRNNQVPGFTLSQVQNICNQ